MYVQNTIKVVGKYLKESFYPKHQFLLLGNFDLGKKCQNLLFVIISLKTSYAINGDPIIIFFLSFFNIQVTKE